MAWPPFEAALFDERETISMTTKATSAARAVGPTYPIDPSGEGGFSRWFFTGMAILLLATSIAGFGPAILNPAGRRAPLSLLGAAHGIVFSPGWFFSWYKLCWWSPGVSRGIDGWVSLRHLRFRS